MKNKENEIGYLEYTREIIPLKFIQFDRYQPRKELQEPIHLENERNNLFKADDGFNR